MSWLQKNFCFTWPLVNNQVVFELARADICSEVGTEVLFVAAMEEFLFYLADVGQVVGLGDINLALVD